jgi:TP901 family phage tail tape measure protein
MSLARSVSVRLDANVSGYIAKMNSAGAATAAAMGKADKSVAGHSKGLAVMGKAAAVGGLGLVALGGYAVKTAANFDASMSKVEAATGKGGKSLDALRKAAIDAGAKTVFSASEAAGGIENLAKAGVSTQNILGGGLRGALDLAAAGELQVSDAAEIAATALTQFKLKGSDIPHVADLLAAGAGKAQGEVTDLAAALNQAGLVAAGSGLSIEETTGTLAAFASAGLTGSDAGTSFKTMLQRLQAPVGAGAKEMERLNISAYDAQGNLIGMSKVADQLRDRLHGMTGEQRDAALATIFGSDAVRAARVLYDQGGRGIDKWTKAVDDQGFAARTAGTRLNNLKGDLEQLGGSFETAMIKLGSGAQSPLRGVVQDITGEINKLSENGTLERWGDNAADAIGNVIDIAKDLGPAVGSALSTVGSGVKAVADGFSSLPSGVQKALVTGAVVAAGAKKLGVTSLVGAAAKTVTGGGIGGRGGVVPVFVTNMGKGGLPGGGGKGGGPLGLGGKVAAGYAAAGGAAAAGTVAAVAATLAGVALVIKRFGDSVDAQINRGKPIPQGDLGRPTKFGDYNRPLETQVLNPFGKNEDGTIKSAQVFSRAGGMIAAAFAGANKTLRSTALDMDQFRFQTEAAGISSGELSSKMKSLPQTVQTKILTPGALESKGQVTALGKQFGLTPKQVRTIMELVGATKAVENTDRVRKGMRTLNQTSAKPKVLPQGMEETTGKAKTTKRALDGLVRTFKSRLAADDGSSPKARAAKKAGLDFARAYKASLQAGDSASPKARSARATAAAFAKTYLAALKAANATGPGVAAARAAVNSVQSRTVTITTVHRDIRVASSAGRAANPSLNADGGFYDGGIKAFAGGGTTEGGAYVPRVPQMRRGAGRGVLWGEEETGWEAYISGKPGMRDRNLQVLSQAADRLGADIVRRYADGGLTSYAGGGIRPTPGQGPLPYNIIQLIMDLRLIARRGYTDDRARARAVAKGIEDGKSVKGFAGDMRGFAKEMTQLLKRTAGRSPGRGRDNRPEIRRLRNDLEFVLSTMKKRTVTDAGILRNATAALTVAQRELNVADRNRKRREHETTAAYKHHVREVKGLANELGKTTDKLKTQREARREYAGTVASAYVKDPFSGTLGGFRNQVAFETRSIRSAAADLRTARARGLDGALYKGLAASGNVGLIDQFSKLSRAQIAAEERRYAMLNVADRRIGAQAANVVYNASIRTLTGQVKHLTAELHRLRTGKALGGNHTHFHGNVKAKNTEELAKKLHRRARVSAMTAKSA